MGSGGSFPAIATRSSSLPGMGRDVDGLVFLLGVESG